MNSSAILEKIADIPNIDSGLKNEILQTIISLSADIGDNKINAGLLNKLIFKYADTEKKLFELNQLKNKFLGIAAHDLRNPLTSIRGFSELLLGGELGDVPEEHKEFISMICTLSQSMLDMVNDLLDVSVIESGKLTLEKKTGHINDLVKHRIKISAIIAEAKGMKIKQSCAGIPPFDFDEIRIGQVVDNLISNAIKFSPHNSVIEISTALSGKEAIVQVADHGPGISQQDREKLFGEFAKLSARPTGEEKSTGLGLAICKKIIQAHDGRIWAKNKEGAGTIFSIALPVENVK
ncbi:MAG: HAMP domain-containing histidine kinase [Desulfobacteraceae bacterium]|nr:HAMP domain-containing histidine kinase [Desulfobacteraceae bacterium]